MKPSDYSSWTIEQLKSHLTKNNVELPPQAKNKQYYLGLVLQLAEMQRDPLASNESGDNGGDGDNVASNGKDGGRASDRLHTRAASETTSEAAANKNRQHRGRCFMRVCYSLLGVLAVSVALAAIAVPYIVRGFYVQEKVGPPSHFSVVITGSRVHFQRDEHGVMQVLTSPLMLNSYLHSSRLVTTPLLSSYFSNGLSPWTAKCMLCLPVP